MKKYHPAAGTNLSELDTPVLFLDIEAVEKNYKAVAETYKDTACKMRQHTKNIKSPLLALMQIWAGGTVGECVRLRLQKPKQWYILGLLIY